MDLLLATLGRDVSLQQVKFFSLDSSLQFWGVKTILKIAEARPSGAPDMEIPRGWAVVV